MQILLKESKQNEFSKKILDFTKKIITIRVNNCQSPWKTVEGVSSERKKGVKIICLRCNR